MTVYTALVVLHIVCGLFALPTYWLSGLTKKGSPVHRRSGQIYLIAMVGILITGLPMIVFQIARGEVIGPMFLGYLLLLVGSSCWTAWRAIRDKRSPERYFGRVHWCVMGAPALAGLAMVGVGIQSGIGILMVFGSIGPVSFIGSLLARRRARSLPTWWLREHYGAMIGNGVGTHIAFFNIGLRKLVPGIDPALLQNLSWFIPLLVAGIAAVWISYRYGGKRRPQSISTQAGA